jgi:hypothetical protein
VTQAAKIQAVWKGWHQRSVAKKNKAALAIQKLVRGRQQRTKWRVLKAASMIQRNWRMYREVPGGATRLCRNRPDLRNLSGCGG